MKTALLVLVSWAIFGPFLFAVVGPRLESMRKRTVALWVIASGPSIWIGVAIIMWCFRKRVP
jgi:hypothetical protein